ncbi:helix-turn-helix domain-containing protein [Maricaulis sp.]|uniref:helix-turn-helix domain-containing protein n=1 Tax=Maricaulis sp. TaxID=1486257 RepID=UPI002611F043|nr:helix-turn-helix domain-containing protein [Maricaulis sp.]
MSGQASGTDFVPVDAVYTDDGVGYVSMTAGERLREARARMNLSLKQAADATRIRSDYLEALETMDSRGLPARAYAIGYLRTYASFLSLEPAGVVEQFKREVDTETGRAQPTAAAKTREPIKLPRGAFGAILILIALASVAWWYAEQTSGNPILNNLPSPPDAAPEWARADFDARSPASVDAIWSDLPIGADPAGIGDVVMRAEAPTWMEVRDASGRILFSRDVLPGETYRALEPGLTVSAEDAGAIILVRDGEVIGPLGEPGMVVENLPVLPEPATVAENQPR